MTNEAQRSVDTAIGREMLTEEVVEDTLAELYEKGVLSNMRANQQVPWTFFDPNEGYLNDDDESSTGSVLDMFREAILNGEVVAKKGLYSEEDVQNMVDALEPGSVGRKVLLAYWDVSESTPWNETSNNIVDKQTFLNEGFPTVGDVLRVSSNLGISESES